MIDFFEMCLQIMYNTTLYHGEMKSVNNYKRWLYYKENYFRVSLDDVRDFIREVRDGNPIHEADKKFQSMKYKTRQRKFRPLEELTESELYTELTYEKADVVYNATYECILLHNNPTGKSLITLPARFLFEDPTIFKQFLHL